MGPVGGKAGAIQVEGDHYCPGTPKLYLNASKEAQAKLIDEETYQLRLQGRQAFRLREKERPDERGRVPKMCPALGPQATIECPLAELLATRRVAEGGKPVKQSARSKSRVNDADVPVVEHQICRQHSVSFGPEDGLKHKQDAVYGTPQWAAEYKEDRNIAEGYNGMMKEEGKENAASGSRRRLRGLAAQQFLITILIVSVNLRKIETFLEELKEELKATILHEEVVVKDKTARRRDRDGRSHYYRDWFAPPGSTSNDDVDPPPKRA